MPVRVGAVVLVWAARDRGRGVARRAVPDRSRWPSFCCRRRYNPPAVRWFGRV